MKKRRIVQLAALAVFCCAVALLLPRLRQVDAQEILTWVPARPGAAAAVLLLFYAAKSLTFFFPLAVLQAAAGLLFPVGWALALNLAGVSISLTLPYLLGCRKQAQMDALLDRTPKLRRLQEFRQNSDFLFVLLVRLTGMFPGDAVSVYMGAAGLPYRVYLSASLLGMLPHLTAVTVLGASLSDPAGEPFFISLALSAVVSVGAVTVWRTQRQRSIG